MNFPQVKEPHINNPQNLPTPLPPHPHPILHQNPSSSPTPKRNGHWSEKEQIKYYAFLIKFSKIFKGKQTRRQCKIFKIMASFIKTRDPNQCRSHHHKMNKNFNDVMETIYFIGNKLNHLKDKYLKYQQELASISYAIRKYGIFQQNATKNYQPTRSNQDNEQLSKPNHYFQQQKLNDIGNLQTDITSNNAIDQPIINLSGSYFPAPVSPLKGFPTTGIINSSIEAVPIYYIQNNGFQYNPYIVSSQLSSNISQEWQQCHDYFMGWMKKLQGLNS